MSSFLQNLTTAIPTAAQSPYALVAYIIAASAGVFLIWNAANNRSQARLLALLPERDRKTRLTEIIGRPIPEDITADQWLRGRTQLLIFAAFVIICLTIYTVLAIAISKTAQQEESSTEKIRHVTITTNRVYIEHLLGSPAYTSLSDDGNREDVYVDNFYIAGIVQ